MFLNKPLSPWIRISARPTEKSKLFFLSDEINFEKITTEKVKICLEKLNEQFLKSQNILMFGDFPDSWKTCILKFCKAKGFIFSHIYPKGYVKYRMNVQDIKICEGYTFLDSLKVEDIPDMIKYSGKDNNFPVPYIKYCIENDNTSCIRDDDEKIIAWCMTYPEYQAIGTLYVVKKYRRKGLAQKIVEDLMYKAVKHKKTHIDSHVLVENIPSNGLFEKLKFVKMKELRWWMFVGKNKKYLEKIVW